MATATEETVMTNTTAYRLTVAIDSLAAKAAAKLADARGAVEDAMHVENGEETAHAAIADVEFCGEMLRLLGATEQADQVFAQVAALLDTLNAAIYA
jgi:hypothetical protein